jgi:hypothetical protein
MPKFLQDVDEQLARDKVVFRDQNVHWASNCELSIQRREHFDCNPKGLGNNRRAN